MQSHAAWEANWRLFLRRQKCRRRRTRRRIFYDDDPSLAAFLRALVCQRMCERVGLIDLSSPTAKSWEGQSSAQMFDLLPYASLGKCGARKACALANECLLQVLTQPQSGTRKKGPRLPVTFRTRGIACSKWGQTKVAFSPSSR